MKLIRRFRYAITVPLAVLFGLLAAGPAYAATNGPYFDSNAYGTGCAGSGSWYVAASSPLTNNQGVRGGYVQLWYSNNCGTNWGRLVVQAPSGATVYSQSAGSETHRYGGNNLTDVWTSNLYFLGDGTTISGQVYAPQNYACAYADYNSSAGYFSGSACA